MNINKIIEKLKSEKVNLLTKEIKNNPQVKQQTLETFLEKDLPSNISSIARTQMFKRCTKEDIEEINNKLKSKNYFVWTNDYQKTKLSGFRDYSIIPKYNNYYPTLTLSGNEGYILLDDQLSTKSNFRKLTINERERLQGYPVDWTRYGIDENNQKVEICKTDRVKMCGNGVSSPIPAFILDQLTTESNINLMSLCSGCGGTELQLDKTKYKIVGLSEFSKKPSMVLKYHHPKIRNFGDLSKINLDELPDFDLLTFGFPCQAYSMAGLRKGLEDPRGALIYSIFKIIDHKKPKYLLAENVLGLLTHNKGSTFSEIIKTIDQLGYDVGFNIFKTVDFGLPQNRQRVYIYAIRRD